MIYRSALFSALCFFALQAQAVVIDFEPPPCLDCGYGKYSWSEDGFIVSGRFTHYGSGDWSGDVFSNGSEGAIRTAISTESEVNLAHGAGKLFNITSVEIAPYSYLYNNATVTFIGLKANGSTVTQTFAHSGSGFAEYIFNPEFSRLQSLSVARTSSLQGEPIVPLASYDNFNVSAIPLPPAVWLLGSGLLTLAGLRRRRTA